MRRLLTALLFVAAPAAAAPCPPAVALSGDDAAIRAVREQLGARGIAPELPRCPVVRARVERRAGGLVVGVDGPDGVAIERTVSEPATAATVIESWTRGDVAAPLLAARALPGGPETGDTGNTGDTGDAARAPAHEPTERLDAARAPAAPAATGIQLFAAAETLAATDHTLWQGVDLGACVMQGPLCVGARLAAGKVIDQPTSWDGFGRVGAQALLEVDVPIAIGWARLTPGVAIGYGTMFTRHRGDGEHMGLEISGPRTELHAALSLPVSPHFALDVLASATLTQAARVERDSVMGGPPTAEFPREPRALIGLAIGLRYGAL